MSSSVSDYGSSKSYSSTSDMCGHCGWIIGLTKLTNFFAEFYRDGVFDHSYSQVGESLMLSCTSFDFAAVKSNDPSQTPQNFTAGYSPSTGKWVLGSLGANAMFTAGGIGAGCSGPNDTTVSGNRSWNISSSIVTE